MKVLALDRGSDGHVMPAVVVLRELKQHYPMQRYGSDAIGICHYYCHIR
jgi:hypothetical protein